MKKYKLTDQDMQTYQCCKWKLGVEKQTSGEGKLCCSGWLHYYHHPLLAILLNPIHAYIENPRLFEANCTGKHLDDNGLKGGCTKMTLLKEIEVPKITETQRVAFGILCAKEVYKDEKWNLWASDWLSGKDRIAKSAARWTASTAEKCAAEWAAISASMSASMSAKWVKWVAEWEAMSAASAAEWAASTVENKKFDLIKLAKEALKY